MRWGRTAAVALSGLLLAGCQSHSPRAAGHRAQLSATHARTASTSVQAPTSSAPGSGHAAVTSSGPAPSSSAAPTPRQLPRGGKKILGHFRVVADYGTPGAPALGVLGQATPDAAARAVLGRAKGFASFGEPVLPAMELITTVAQASPGPYGAYSAPIPKPLVARYLALAHKYRMLLILDLQPGRASFLSQAKDLHRFLLDPSVAVGLDPEWKVTSGAPGGGRIGSSSAAGINAVSHYLSVLVHDHQLPDKLMVVHEFTSSMLPDRENITTPRGVEVSIHADGFGTPEVKRGVFHQLQLPGRPFGIGFKLFLTQDSRLMSPSEVMALRPRPDVITYQ